MYRTAVRAKKKAEVAEEWASLARDDQLSDEEDPGLQRSINEVCNKGLRYMLRGETNRLLDYRDELSRFGQYFSDQNNVAGATFIYVLYKMTEHILPKQMVSLEGIYLEAFRKMFGMLEDSGWQLSSEPEEGEELDLLEEPTDEDLQKLGYTVTE
ncbi:g1799 [Coccomyxa elongata]